MPNMPNRMKTNSKNTTTFASAGSEFSNEETSLLMLGNALILLNGLTTLRVLITLRFGNPGTNSRPPTTTAVKSIMSHGSHKYGVLWTTNPKAIIFKTHSHTNTTVKPQLIFSRTLFL